MEGRYECRSVRSEIAGAVLGQQNRGGDTATMFSTGPLAGVTVGILHRVNGPALEFGQLLS